MTMSPVPQRDPHAISNAIENMNQVGNASEKLFSRLYRGITRRSKQPGDGQIDLQAKLRLSEEEIQRLHGVLATLDEGLIMQDNEGRIVLVNNAARNLLGGIKTFWQSELGTLFNNFRDIHALDAEISPLSEPTRVQVNNRVISARLAAVADEHGSRLGTLIVLKDATRDAVSDRLKDQFVTAMSHELRTPLTVIKGMSDLIAEQVETGQKPERRLIETLTRNVDVLDRMIVELLDVSELNADQLNLREERLAVQDMLWSVVCGLSPEIRRAGLDVRVMARDNDSMIIRGDDTKLRWAIGHILENAIRYTEPGGKIVVLASRQADNIAIQFSDTGVGISDRDLPHIFDQFYRGEARAPGGKLIDPRGLGQGLYIARRVAEAHGGYLSVKTSVGQGSLFTFVVPAA